jgi:coproporphyrinogen III oxidase
MSQCNTHTQSLTDEFPRMQLNDIRTLYEDEKRGVKSVFWEDWSEAEARNYMRANGNVGDVSLHLHTIVVRSRELSTATVCSDHQCC